MRRPALLLAGLLLAAGPALAAPSKPAPPKLSAAPASPPHVVPMPEGVRSAAEREDLPALLRALESIPDGPDGRRAFLEGYAHLQAGRPEEAIPRLRRALERAPDLKSHALYFLALAAEKRKDDEAARGALEELLKADPSHPHAPQAHETLARLALRRAAPREAAKWLWGLLRLYPNHERADAHLALLAQALEEAGDPREAALAWRRLWLDLPESPLSAQAIGRAEGLALLAKPPLPPLQAPDHYLRARRLQRLHRHREALEAYRELDRRFPGSPYAGQVRHRMAIALYSLRRTAEARIALEEAVRSAPPASPARAEARYHLMRNHLRADDKLAFEEDAKLLLQESPNSPWAARGLNLLAHVHGDDGERDLAAKYFEQLIRQYPASPLAPKALWQLSWVRFEERDDAAALKGFQELVRRYPDHPLVPSALHWSGAASERSGERDRAVPHYRDCVRQGRHQYYGHLCLEALGRLAREGLTGAASPPPPGEAGFREWNAPPAGPLEPGALSHWRAAELLASMGLHHLAGEEYERLGPSPYFRYRAAMAFSRRGFHERAAPILQGQFRGAIRTGGADLPPEFWRAIFPLRAGPGQVDGVDPLLVNAIIKAESSFDPRAFSPAGAMGLMQLMPGTGRSLARRVKLSLASDSQLFDPELNVRLGSLYLAGLVKEFGGELVPAIASYNAGRNVVRRWWQKRGDEPMAVFIERIPYQETREYVKRVLGYYREYRRVYGVGRASGSPS